MKIRDLQEYLKDRLNDVQALVQGCCKAFAEDTREVYDLSNQWTSAGNEPDLSGARQFRWQFSPNA